MYERRSLPKERLGMITVNTRLGKIGLVGVWVGGIVCVVPMLS